MRSIDYTPKDEERFWSKVDRSGGEDACWLWTAGKHESGYGIFGLRNLTYKAHRISYTMHSSSPIPDGLFVCHKCDNPPCVNPRHLFLGTAKDNSRDCARKGRIVLPGLRGEQHGCAKLTPEQVLEIRQMGKSGMAQTEIAALYGVTNHAIYRILHRKTWKHL